MNRAWQPGKSEGSKEEGADAESVRRGRTGETERSRWGGRK